MPVPITGIKSTSILYKHAAGGVEPFALFCGEDSCFGTHLEVYPRPSEDIYVCGIGGSEYVEPARLQAGVCAPGEVHPDLARVEEQLLRRPPSG